MVFPILHGAGYVIKTIKDRKWLGKECYILLLRHSEVVRPYTFGLFFGSLYYPCFQPCSNKAPGRYSRWKYICQPLDAL